MPERTVLSDIPIRLSFETVVSRLKLTEEDDLAQARALFADAVALARPKALYRVCYPGDITGDTVPVDEAVFHSAVLAEALMGVHRVFAYVATCGAEVDAWSHREQDPFVGYWLDAIKELILHDAISFLLAHLRETYGIENLSTANPGSGDITNWPIAQQRDLFALLGDVEGDIGVRLTDSFLMLPTKSVSGLAFSSAGGFINCALCHRERCPNRRCEAV